MRVANEIADGIYYDAFLSLCKHISATDAREAANNIRSLVYIEVRDAIANAIGAEQDRMAEDAVAERRGLA